MTRVSLISSSAELRARMRPLTGDTAFSPVGVSAVQFTGAPPDVLIMDCRVDVAMKLAMVGALVESYPATGVLLVCDRPADLALDALRVGVQDILAPDASIEEFGAAVEAIHTATQNRVRQFSDVPDEATMPNPALGRVISIMSPKGGVGKTTVSTNIAVGLALREPGSTVIVDLDIQFGDVATALDLEPAHFLGDVTRGAARYDAVVMKTFLTQHRTGLYAICAPKSPAEADAITAEDVAHLLEMLRAEFRYVVLDTSPGMADPTLAALDATTDLVLLTSMDVPGVRGLRKELDTLTTLDVRPETRHLVLNLVDPKCLLSLSDVEATLRTRVDLTLPRTRGTVHSVNQGKPLLESGTRDPMAKQLAVLVDRLSVTNIASKRQPFWRRGKKEAAA